MPAINNSQLMIYQSYNLPKYPKNGRLPFWAYQNTQKMGDYHFGHTGARATAKNMTLVESICQEIFLVE